MSVDNFIPEVTRAEVQQAFARGPVVIPTLTPVPEGDIKIGNAVKIIQPYAGQARDFTGAFEPDELAGGDVTVLIDRKRFVSQRVDDVDRRQAAGSLDQFTDSQGLTLARDADEYTIHAMIAGAGTGPTAIIDSVAKAKTAVRALAKALDQAEVPEDGRYLLCDAEGKSLLVEAIGDSNATQASGDELRKNVIGTFAGFTVIWSNAFPTGIAGGPGSGAKFLAYHESSAAFAGQIEETKAASPANDFADYVSSLSVYGAKVVRPGTVITGGFAPEDLALLVEPLYPAAPTEG